MFIATVNKVSRCFVQYRTLLLLANSIVVSNTNVGLKPTRTKAHRTKAHMDKNPQVWVKSPHWSLITEEQQFNASCAYYLIGKSKFS